MNVRWMRRLDRILGVPLCWMVGCFLLLVGRRPVPCPPAPRAILVIKFFGMGSVLLTMPFLRALRAAYPHARIHFLTFASNRELLERLPLSMHHWSIRANSLWNFLWDTLLVLRGLRRERIEIVFDIEFFSKYSTLLAVLSGANIRVGYELPPFWRRANLTHPAPLERNRHVVNVFMRQLASVGVSVHEPPTLPRLHATSEEMISLENKLGLQTNDRALIALNINAGATSLERRWPADRFLALAVRLMEEYRHHRFFFTGSADERRYVQAAIDRHEALRNRAVNCAGLLTLGEFFALLQRSKVFITNDSGPMHIASAVGVPLVALFGPESPHFYGPLGEARVLYKPPACSPCLNMYNAKLFQCPYEAMCMRQIDVENVVREVRHLIERSPVALSEVPCKLVGSFR